MLAAVFFFLRISADRGNWWVIAAATRAYNGRGNDLPSTPELLAAMPDPLPATVRQFISEHIRSIAQLELLLLLSREREKTWSVQEAAKALYTADSMTEPLLESLRSIGLVVRSDDAEQRYSYAPKSPELERSVQDLAHEYQERRVTIINLIYSAPAEKLQDFADAFRIRKPKEEN